MTERSAPAIIAFAAASPAEPFPFVEARVNSVVRVSLRAASLHRIGGPLASGITTKYVDVMGDGFYVPWICTGTIAAKVVRLQFFRDGANKNGVGNAMSLPISTMPAKSPVSISLFRGCPLPTTVGEDTDLRPEAWGKSIVAEEGDAKLGLHRKVTPFVAMQPEVIGLAAASYCKP